MDTIVPGALAAFVVDCSIFPLDTVKSRIQAADFQTRYPGGRGLYKGLWQGFGPVVVATLPSAALFFTTYEHAKITFTSSDTPFIGQAKAVGHAAASAVAEMAACLILTPAETIKQQRQSTSVFEDLKFRSLRQGYWALVSRNLPFTAMQFPLYEYFRQHLTGPPNYLKAGLVSGASAASAGAISALVTTPLDLVKTRIMLGPTKGEMQNAPSQTIAGVGRDIWQREGLRGLMKGGTLRSVWTALGAGIYLGSYEAGREWWGNSGKEQAQQAIEEVKEKVEEVQTS
ncbi:mitochondrial carrier [Meira miltonrushii]|uniref:Mitochondrial carrier n=1 Tax=Meira miltonrushii TaxID=1280837 RepID=A0A316V6T8_9BASI|nr:mitochondrial carrier [Meira miltonrushii]PWN33236.1 mitochondrial carrier [Meira miltonrushii]